MNEPQTSITGGQRLFFAIAVTPWLSELMKIQQALKEKTQNMSNQIIWHPIESLHITLVFIGEINDILKNEIEENVRLQFSQTPFASFKVIATKISVLSQRHIIVSLNAPMLNDLYERLHLAMPVSKKIKKERAYYAHIALAKLKNPRMVGKIYEALEGMSVDKLQSLQINDFHLYLSKPHRQYTSLTSYALINKK